MKEIISNKNKIKLLKVFLKKKNCDYYLLPRTDMFMNEFLLEEDERVKWLTNFSGSFAFVIVSQKQNLIFTDGRYLNQIKKEVNKNLFKIIDVNYKNPLCWLRENLKKEETVLLDSWLFSSKNFNNLKSIISKKKAKIILSNEIFIDKIWKKKKRKIYKNFFIRDLKYSGISVKNKIKDIKKIFKAKEIKNFFFASPESISWLFNIRSNQIKYTPVILSFLLLNVDKESYFFFKKDLNLKKYLTSKFKVFDISELKKILINFSILNKEVFLDPSKTSYFIENYLKILGVNVKYFDDPCSNLKLIKNHAEIKGAKNAHIRDGVSICKFLFWLNQKIQKGKKVTELLASKKLFDFRRKNKLFQGLSFETISGFGSNGSIIHYRVSKDTNKTFKKNNLYLFDSGGQYLDGTTDITRTVNIGDNPTYEQKIMFTRVLKGNMELSNHLFTKKTTGKQLDKIARKHLKKKYDYSHGTGHGVGSYLSVHEGPISISKESKTTFKKGMLVTNEPGFYKINDFGIRLENILLITNKKKLLGFEILTYAPIDIKLIETKLLNIKEKRWINLYHYNVFKKINKFLNANERNWLKKNTMPI